MAGPAETYAHGYTFVVYILETVTLVIKVQADNQLNKNQLSGLVGHHDEKLISFSCLSGCCP